jgi:hypothetical protein
MTIEKPEVVTNSNSNIEIVSVVRTKDVGVINAPGMTIRQHKVATTSKELMWRDENGSIYVFKVKTKYEYSVELDDNSQAISSETEHFMSDYIDSVYKSLLAAGKIKSDSKDLV